MKKENKKHVCSICLNLYRGFGNNAQPVNNGRCCDDCNMTRVLPERLKLFFQQKSELQEGEECGVCGRVAEQDGKCEVCEYQRQSKVLTGK